TPQGVPAGMTLFINDSSYAPQSETSVAVNPLNTQQVVGGYNDAKYFFCPDLPAQDCPNGYTESVTGFTTSADGGATVAKSNDLPGLAVTETNLTSGASVSGFLVSWGDPSLVAAPDGTFYFASLAIDPVTGVSGIMIEQSNSNLWNPGVDCSTPLTNPGFNPCWTPHLVFGNLSFQCSFGSCGQATFEDKDTVAVDTNPTSPYYGDIYVAWDHFFANGDSGSYAARCSPSLTCTMISGGGLPLVSGTDPYVAFTTPAVDSNGNVYLSWCNFGTATTYGPVDCSVSSSPPGGVAFGAAHSALSFMGAGTQLAGDTVVIGFATEQFRTASELTLAAGAAGNVYFAISVCVSGFYYRFNNIPTLPSDNPGNCGASAIYFVKSANGGVTWSAPLQVSVQGVEIQPTLSVDSSTGAVVLAYYTSQFDPFEHMLDVGVAVSHDGGSSFSFIRATSVSNEPNSDPAGYNYMSASGFGGSFVVPQYGDYFTADAVGGQVWILFTGNYAKEQGTYKDSPFLTVIGEVPASLSLSSNAKDAAPGAVVTFSAGGFPAGSAVSLDVTWNGVSLSLANSTASQAGVATGNFTVPNVQSQVYTVVASDGLGTTSSASLGVGQVSLANLQGMIGSLNTAVTSGFSTVTGELTGLSSTVTSGLSTVKGNLSTLATTMTAGFASLSGSVSTLSSNVATGVGSILSAVQSFNSLSSQSTTLGYLEVLTAAIFILLIVLLVMQLRSRRPRSGQTAAPHQLAGEVAAPASTA
ncbi:MAG: hypothetical protein JRM99_08020, partial [Nitrososphaerota archaeon]|nr:hypothetical protein [Nitrososphaerota archaeon]